MDFCIRFFLHKKSPTRCWMMKSDVWDVGKGLSTRVFPVSDTVMPSEQSETNKLFMMPRKDTCAESLGLHPSSYVTQF